MASPSQRRGGCGHMMAGFDLHSVCARCRDKKKGSDPCTKSPPEDCQHCDAFTPEQKTQIATPSYKLKKEKKDAKSTPAKDSDNSTLVDPALVSVLAVVDNQSTPGASTSEPVEKKKKTDPKHSKSSKSEKSVKQSSNRPATTSSESKPHSSSTDTKLLDMDKKWAERFNRLEALFLAKTVDPPRDPVFSTVKVTPAHAPPANVVRSDPFIKPQPQISQPTDPAGDSATDSSLHKSDVKTSSTQPDPPATAAVKKDLSSAFDVSRKESSSSDSDSDSSSDQPLLDILPEEGELSDEMDANLSDQEQSLSEEQSYRETMRGIRSYMGWDHIPDIDSGTTTSEDNPFAGPKPHAPGKVSINLPTDEWLCRKMAKLNITLTQGYPSRTSEAGGLQRDQFVRPPKSQQKWYGFHSNPKTDTEQSVSSWHTSSSKLNSTYLRIARQASIASQPPMSRPISQETLRKWERSARESTIICNHAASFNRCLLKVQQNMNSQLKAVRIESKGKTAVKVTDAVNELQFLLDFNSSICQAMAKAMEHLTEFIFVNMANTTLLRRDSYLKAGIKADTLNALRSAPLHLDTLFPDSIIKRAEEDITSFDKGRSGSSSYKGRRFHPYEHHDHKSDKQQERPAWKNLSRTQRRKQRKQSQYSSRPAKGQQQYK